VAEVLNNAAPRARTRANSKRSSNTRSTPATTSVARVLQLTPSRQRRTRNAQSPLDNTATPASSKATSTAAPSTVMLTPKQNRDRNFEHTASGSALESPADMEPAVASVNSRASGTQSTSLDVVTQTAAKLPAGASQLPVRDIQSSSSCGVPPVNRQSSMLDWFLPWRRSSLSEEDHASPEWSELHQRQSDPLLQALPPLTPTGDAWTDTVAEISANAETAAANAEAAAALAYSYQRSPQPYGNVPAVALGPESQPSHGNRDSNATAEDQITTASLPAPERYAGDDVVHTRGTRGAVPRGTRGAVQRGTRGAMPPQHSTETHAPRSYDGSKRPRAHADARIAVHDDRDVNANRNVDRNVSESRNDETDEVRVVRKENDEGWYAAGTVEGSPRNHESGARAGTPGPGMVENMPSLAEFGTPAARRRRIEAEQDRAEVPVVRRASAVRGMLPVFVAASQGSERSRGVGESCIAFTKNGGRCKSFVCAKASAAGLRFCASHFGQECRSTGSVRTSSMGSSSPPASLISRDEGNTGR
jgi:hypothetical protein